jgi:Zn-dependent protease with chaperone function
MACTECISSFFFTPWKLGMVLVAVALSIIFFALMKREHSIQKKLLYLYAHLFSAVFPVLFYTFYRGCTSLLNQCKTIPPVLLLILLTGLITAVLAMTIGPIIFLRKYTQNSIQTSIAEKFFKRSTKKLQISRPELIIVNQQDPLAFSIAYWKARIFISVGLIELLSQKELEAVLAHEMGHIQRRSSVLKFSASLFRMISPLRSFASFHSELNDEEYLADEVAVTLQGTKKHIVTARRKIIEYETAKQQPR